ncbi:bifunctional diaminohydroxyphosphoribosylaminopyrimidine deaminase/5-amino-6-(5-phosphoribosylamino)uracil reductase RibD [Phycisphaera mikurensis]|uniref:Riboflavin biosynthesis protein RibD n=1 Tax=Phycisphaera mikurensis (strain NBRC 102666 / KCTC 22515 / FYK2301M01) TaxID=1142394 RepID=I0IIB0_PHYMF|nr:bifunctional diaminohydroxyphosphoribosylaminopyrimidine deaminase/5-amino-6-(5-phosphoribosylamino)uracil reductase RibD [Phycisphaera mikurensis]MBB6442439.1 diaminohydroxyphosphoribosylaminopyrimidine deaminase/5-amino-6-(5-phosphoribosylamino)uracil reductase [Phycisphaera mikurensis]BAM04998.1 diaminohydroxyphosphoribosylaminopyrimidine deaminase/5-amino-6-(5-phosphoribosylamino)uracil reductase [Phycisphaera mikurensis NBRC 102666]
MLPPRPSPWETDATLTEAQAMAAAVRLAERATGRVEPNPRVGCVLLAAGPVERPRPVLGRGFHRRFGGPHAEVQALADARRRGPLAPGFTAVVTLEPCRHTGKTPPCTEALLAAGVGRVVAGEVDPDPRVSGGGFGRLRAAGVEAVAAPTPGTAWLLAPFAKRLATGLPWVIAKWAQTLDGCVATAGGDSKWISNEASRRRVHRLRARVDAVLTGAGTAVADDPRLTARGVRVHRRARRVVFDRSGRLPAGAALRERGGPPLEVTADPPEAVLRRLAADGCTRVLLEAGPGLAGAFFAAGLVDEIHAYVAPLLLGDPAGLGPAAAGSMERMAGARPLRLVSASRLGDDLCLVYAVNRDPASPG